MYSKELTLRMCAYVCLCVYPGCKHPPESSDVPVWFCEATNWHAAGSGPAYLHLQQPKDESSTCHRRQHGSVLWEWTAALRTHLPAGATNTNINVYKIIYACELSSFLVVHPSGDFNTFLTVRGASHHHCSILEHLMLSSPNTRLCRHVLLMFSPLVSQIELEGNQSRKHIIAFHLLN